MFYPQSPSFKSDFQVASLMEQHQNADDKGLVSKKQRILIKSDKKNLYDYNMGPSYGGQAPEEQGYSGGSFPSQLGNIFDRVAIEEQLLQNSFSQSTNKGNITSAFASSGKKKLDFQQIVNFSSEKRISNLKEEKLRDIISNSDQKIVELLRVCDSDRQKTCQLHNQEILFISQGEQFSCFCIDCVSSGSNNGKEMKNVKKATQEVRSQFDEILANLQLKIDFLIFDQDRNGNNQIEFIENIESLQREVTEKCAKVIQIIKQKEDYLLSFAEDVMVEKCLIFDQLSAEARQKTNFFMESYQTLQQAANTLDDVEICQYFENQYQPLLLLENEAFIASRENGNEFEGENQARNSSEFQMKINLNLRNVNYEKILQSINSWEIQEEKNDKFRLNPSFNQQKDSQLSARARNFDQQIESDRQLFIFDQINISGGGGGLGGTAPFSGINIPSSSTPADIRTSQFRSVNNSPFRNQIRLSAYNQQKELPETSVLSFSSLNIMPSTTLNLLNYSQNQHFILNSNNSSNNHQNNNNNSHNNSININNSVMQMQNLSRNSSSQQLEHLMQMQHSNSQKDFQPINLKIYRGSTMGGGGIGAGGSNGSPNHQKYINDWLEQNVQTNRGFTSRRLQDYEKSLNNKISNLKKEPIGASVMDILKEQSKNFQIFKSSSSKKLN